MSRNAENTVMTVPEVAEFFKMTEGTVRRLAREGSLPGRKVGGEWRFLRKSIETFLEQPVLEEILTPDSKATDDISPSG